MNRLFLLGLALTISACVHQSSPSDGGDDAALPQPATPIRAFKKVGQPIPSAAGGVRDTDDLSSDILRLQDARRAYRAERSFEAAETRHRQQECRESGQGEEVPIEDGGVDPLTYCQQVPDDDGSTGSATRSGD